MSAALPKPSSPADARVDAIEVFEKHGYTRKEALAFLVDRSVTGEIPGGVLVVDGERKHRCGACPKIKAVTAEGAAFISEQLKIAIKDRLAKKKPAAGKKRARALRPRQPSQPRSLPEPPVEPFLPKLLSDVGLGTTPAAVKMFDALAARGWETRYMATKKLDEHTSLHAWTHFDKPFLVDFAMGKY